MRRKRRKLRNSLRKELKNRLILSPNLLYIECYDEQYGDWIEADEEEPPKLELGAGVARIILKKEVLCMFNQFVDQSRPPHVVHTVRLGLKVSC